MFIVTNEEKRCNCQASVRSRLSEEHLGDKVTLNHSEGSVTEWVAFTLHFGSGKKTHHYSSIFFAYVVEADQ